MRNYENYLSYYYNYVKLYLIYVHADVPSQYNSRECSNTAWI
jgi:hypothetical protein